MPAVEWRIALEADILLAMHIRMPTKDQRARKTCGELAMSAEIITNARLTGLQLAAPTGF